MFFRTTSGVIVSLFPPGAVQSDVLRRGAVCAAAGGHPDVGARFLEGWSRPRSKTQQAKGSD